MITVVGSLNMDLVINTEKIPRPGETVLGSSFKQIPGGKGGNQAAAAARLGVEVTMIGAVGKDDFGAELINSLKKDGVKTECIIEKEELSTGIAAIIVENSGNNAITVVSGANFDLTSKNISDHKSIISQSKIMLVQLETPLETVREALEIAKECGLTTILNPAPAATLFDDILRNVDILTPNEIELELLSGLQWESLEELLIAGNVLINKGIKELIVTLGEHGCVRINKDGIKPYAARKVKALDTTAAGDCFNGALAVALSEGKVMDEAIKFAISASALSVTKFGAQTSLPSRTEVDNFNDN